MARSGHATDLRPPSAPVPELAEAWVGPLVAMVTVQTAVSFLSRIAPTLAPRVGWPAESVGYLSSLITAGSIFVLLLASPLQRRAGSMRTLQIGVAPRAATLALVATRRVRPVRVRAPVLRHRGRHADRACVAADPGAGVLHDRAGGADRARAAAPGAIRGALLAAGCAPAMEALLARSRETVHLSVLDEDDVVYVHKLESPEPVRAYSQVGGRAPAYCVATGKAMLAFTSEVMLGALAKSLKRYTPRTIVEPEEFLREMHRIRLQGYAVNRGEWRESVCGVAAPIRDPSGQVIAAIGISGPAERLRPARFKVLGQQMIAAAAAIERAVAGEPSAPQKATERRVRRTLRAEAAR
jgi:DNA-binding IclR family transcriptional regulator